MKTNEQTVPLAWTNLLAYVLQDDLHNRLTPRVVDIAYTAFMQAKRPNAEDGGASDWFNDTKPVVMQAIDKLREDLLAEGHLPAASEAEPNDPVMSHAEAVAAIARNTIVRLKAKLRAASEAGAVPWSNLPAYLIDHCEGDIITEEGLQRALAAMLADPKYATTVKAGAAPVAYLHADYTWEKGESNLTTPWPVAVFSHAAPPAPVEAGAEAAIAAIQFALKADEGMAWLRCWNEGDFDACRKEWPETPEACFIGADPLHPDTRATLNAAPSDAPAPVEAGEHYDEVKATLEGAHRIMESLSAIERRVGPIGSHARGYTHKITAALRHLDALVAARSNAGAVPVAYADKAAFLSAMKNGKGCDVWPHRGDGSRETIALCLSAPSPVDAGAAEDSKRLEWLIQNEAFVLKDLTRFRLFRVDDELKVQPYHGWGTEHTYTHPRVAIDSGRLSAPSDAPAQKDMRMETTSEHIARDIREGRFPQRSERQMVAAAPAAQDAPECNGSHDAGQIAAGDPECTVCAPSDAPPPVSTLTTEEAHARAPAGYSYTEAGCWRVGWNAAVDAMNAAPSDGPVQEDKTSGCNEAPAGYQCTRLSGHDGSCAVRVAYDHLKPAAQDSKDAPAQQATWDDFTQLAIKHGCYVPGYGPFAVELLATYGKAPKEQPHWVDGWLNAMRAVERDKPAPAAQGHRCAACYSKPTSCEACKRIDAGRDWIQDAPKKGFVERWTEAIKSLPMGDSAPASQCPECKGDGCGVSAYGTATCDRCNGTGKVPAAQGDERAVSHFLADVMTAAGLVTHGKQCKALGARLGEGCMKFRVALSRQPSTELFMIGAQLANVAFNWSQQPGKVLDESACKMLRDLTEQWDAARAQRAGKGDE